MTLHVLWITAKDRRLEDATAPQLEMLFDDTRHRDYTPLRELGHSIKDYYFGQPDTPYGKSKTPPLEDKAILQFIRNMRIDSDDAIMVYYRGHGAFDENTRNQYYADIDGNGNNLYHSDLRLAVEKLNPRLSVFIRDCCNMVPPTKSSGGTVMHPGAPSEDEPVHLSPKLFQSLFVNSRGIVDVGSAKKDFAASFSIKDQNDCYSYHGTVFTGAFAEIYESRYNEPLDWERFLGLVFGRCENRFQRKLLPQVEKEFGRREREKTEQACGKHTPHAYVVGGIYTVPNFERLLWNSTIPERHFHWEGKPIYGGVQLTRVQKGKRGDNEGFEENDIIYAVDDIPVTTDKELDLAVRVLGDDGKLKITLINSRDGKVDVWDFPDIRSSSTE